MFWTVWVQDTSSPYKIETKLKTQAGDVDAEVINIWIKATATRVEETAWINM